MLREAGLGVGRHMAETLRWLQENKEESKHV